MPWSSGSDDGPLIVRLDGLCVVLQPRHAAPLNAERQRHWQQRFKQRRLPPRRLEEASGAQAAAAQQQIDDVAAPGARRRAAAQLARQRDGLARAVPALQQGGGGYGGWLYP